MKIFASIMISLCASLAFAADERDQPGDMFVRAYTTAKNAEKFAQKGAVPQAVQSYLEATAILDAIRIRFPNWQTQIVEFRKRKVLEKLNELVPRPDAAERRGQSLAFTFLVANSMKNSPALYYCVASGTGFLARRARRSNV